MYDCPETWCLHHGVKCVWLDDIRHNSYCECASGMRTTNSNSLLFTPDYRYNLIAVLEQYLEDMHCSDIGWNQAIQDKTLQITY
jgi:hypothetical protein